MNSRRMQLALKRGLDLLGAAMTAVVLSPVLAWVALAVAATAGRPVLFRQARPGLAGRSFTILKFRTMRAPRVGEVWYLTDGQRITRLGRFLRATSLDELPEFWNVLRGDMSFVGPRPASPGVPRQVHAGGEAAAQHAAGYHRLGCRERAQRAPV